MTLAFLREKIIGKLPMRQMTPMSYADPSWLSFSITGDYPENTFEIDDTRHRMVGSRKGRNLYAIKILNFSASDAHVASLVKLKTVEAIASNKALITPHPSLAEVQKMSHDFLSAYRTDAEKEAISYAIAHDIVGTGPFSILLEDAQNIEEIEVNSPVSNIAIYHSKYGRCTTNLKFNSIGDFRFTVNKLISASNKELSQQCPIIDAQLGDGSRLHAQLAPYAISGAVATIRLGAGKGMSIKKLVASGTVGPDVLAYLWMALENSSNMVVTGAPASGKTSLLLSIHALMPFHERIITVEEDVNELKFYENIENTVSMQGSARDAQRSVRNQIINALHLRPDRLIVGEIRGEETREIFAGSNMGIPFITTMHSSAGGESVVRRLRASPMCVEEHTLCMLDLAVYMQKMPNGGRVLENISEYKWLSRADAMQNVPAPGNDAQINAIVANCKLDKEALKQSKIICGHAARNAVSVQSALSEFRKRAKFLEQLALDQSIITPSDVYKRILSYWEIK
jgi:flagellar protein FlaI